MDNRKDECESPVHTDPVSADGDQHNFTADQNSSESLKLPRHQYTRDQLLAWRDVRCSRLKPSSMSKEYESCEGIWDPEKWFNSTIGECSASGTSGYNSHFTAGEKMYSRGRKPEWDADDGTRRTANKINDKGPGFKQNVGDADVVLMPQRNFNSGCYVSNNDSQHRRDGRDQRFSQRVVGSGRIPVVDRFKGRTSEDVSDSWNERSGANSGRSRGKGIDKRYESGSRSDYKSNTRDTKKQAEPLWYREGPLSQSDTIELRGFNERSDEYHPSERNRKLSLKLKEEKIDEEIEEHDVQKKVKQAGNDKGTNVAESNTKDLSIAGENIKESRNDCEGSNANEFDFAMFAKAVSNPGNQDPELDSRESRFRQFFQTQVSQDSLANGVNVDKKASLPPPPPVYGHSIEKFIDPNEEKKNFMQILQKAQISYQNHQVPNSARTPSVDGITSFNQKPASLKDFESDLKAMLKVNPDSSDGKTINCASGVFYGPIYNGNKTEGAILPSSGSNRNLFLGHKLLPVGSKVTRVSDLEADSVLSESFVNIEGSHSEKSSDPDDMSAYNKLLGLVSQKGPQNHSLANHNYRDSYPVSGSPNYPNKMSDSYHPAMTSSVSSLLASMSNDKRHTHSPSVRSSPIAFGTCPPTNLATPMPIHAGHLINQFNGNQCAKVQFNNLDPTLKFGAQNSIDHPPKEPVITSQSLERMHPAFLPTSVIRQMAQDKAEKKRCLKLDPQSFCPDVFSSGSKVVPQDAMWTVFRSNTGEGGSAVFQPPLYNSQAPHNFSPHNQLQPPCMSVFARPPQQPSVASFLQCLQQGRVITQPQQPQQQQMLHPLLQHQVNNALPAKRAIVKGANNSSIQPDQQNLSLVALQHGQILGNAQVDQSSPADVIAALQQALISKRHNPNSGFEGWQNGASSVNGSSVGRTPNQVKLQ